MKKIFILSAILLITLSACGNDNSSKTESTAESVTESSTIQTEETTEITTKAEAVQTETMSLETLPKKKKLNLGEVDEWSFNSQSKFLYFTDFGCYYPVEVSGTKHRCDVYYALRLDNGIDEPTILHNTEYYNYRSYYCDGNSIYIYIHDRFGNKNGIYKLYNRPV